MRVRPPSTRGASRWAWLELDHRTASRRYFWFGGGFLLFGGVLAMLIRWQWAFPGASVPLLGRPMTPVLYQQTFTLHGLMMIFFGLTPLLGGALGHYAVPATLGSGRLASRKLTGVSFWLFVIACLMGASSLVVELGPPGSGWTSYPPLSTLIGMPGMGQSWVAGAICVLGTSIVLSSANTLATVIRLRPVGMGWLRMPLSTWGFFLAAALNAMFTPVLATAAFFLLSDRHLGTELFVAGASGEGDPLLYQHLFWIFGHPEVYILILPIWGIIGDLLAFFSRKPAYWYRGTVGAMVTVAALSVLVYGHHMFSVGLSPFLGKAFMMLTFLISIPAQVMVLNWLRTLWGGSYESGSPFLYALGSALVFVLGGLGGIYLGAISTDIYLHDSLFVVGHFHLTLAGASFLGVMAGVHFWFPALFGRALDERLARWHCGGSVALFILVFGGMHLAGVSGQPRRLFDPYQYTFLAELLPLQRWIGLAAGLLFAFQLLFLLNLVKTLRRPSTVPANPWRLGTLDWTHPGGLPARDAPAVRRGAHELSNPAWMGALGRDWVGQTESLPADAAPSPSAAGEGARSGGGSGHPAPMPFTPGGEA